MNRILNLGCGNDTYGTDFIDLYPQREEVLKVIIDKEKLPYKDNTFDEIRFNFVFEHLTNQQLVLKEIYRVLKKGGKLNLKTDNANYWYYCLDNKTHTGGYENNQPFGEKDRHYSLFTDLHLMNFAEYIGFKKYSVIYFDNSCAESFKGKIVRLINFILRNFKPIRRMGYGGIQLVAIK